MIWQKHFCLHVLILCVIYTLLNDYFCSVSDNLLIDKSPVISFRVIEDGIRPLDDADGNLVIDTSDGHQVDIELLVISWIQLYGIIWIAYFCTGSYCHISMN